MLQRSRPSQLQAAETCSRSLWISLHYREGNANTRRGQSHDAKASEILTNIKEVPIALVDKSKLSPEVKGILAWVGKTFGSHCCFYVQRKVTLADPRTGEVLSEGTPDMIVVDPLMHTLTIVDWKTQGQMWAGHLADPDDNLQQLDYAVAAALEFSTADCPLDGFKIVLACYDADGVQPRESEIITADQWFGIIDRIKAIPQVDPDEPEPEAQKGEHCQHCWGRLHCAAYLLPKGDDMPGALVPFTQPGELTAESALQALEWADKAEVTVKAGNELIKRVYETIDAFVAANGPIRRGPKQYCQYPKMSNRKPPTVGELEAMGKADLIKPAVPGTAFGWRKVKLQIERKAE